MQRRTLLLGVASLAAGTGVLGLVGGCGVKQVARVGFLGNIWSDAPERADSVRQSLHELGWVESDNLVLDWRYVTGTDPRLAAVATDLVRSVDVVVVDSEPNARAVQRASGSMPIVLAAHPDPVGTGLVASLDRPGGMITGTGGTPGAVIFYKRIESLKAAAPRIRRLAVLLNTLASPAVTAVQLPAVNAATERLGIEVLLAEARAASEIVGALETAVRAGADGLFIIQDPVNFAQRDVVVRFAAEARLPAMYPGNVWVREGGLMSFGASAVEGNRLVATYIDKILRGARPADLPLQQGSVFDFEVNVPALEALGLELPPSVAAQVTRWVT